MNQLKNKPTMPSIRLLVRACPYLPASIAFTVDQAKKASTMAGMNRNISDMTPKNGNWDMFARPGDVRTACWRDRGEDERKD